jgi:uncharacterized protein HemY
VDAVRPLSDLEMHVLWARVASKRDDLSLVDEELTAAAAANGATAEVDYWRGALALRRHDVAAGVRHLEAARAQSAHDARILYALFLAHLAAHDEAAADAVALELAPIAGTSDQISAVAYSRLSRGDLDGALASIDAALAVEPGEYRALTIRAKVLFAAKRFAEAVDTQERAVLRAPESVRDAALLRDLATYRAAAKRGGT